ncbi:NAD(P)/FAD-dependent oxidoreductase [Actinomycetospora sp. NBRC 106378]|uniref:flavin-containing monooxygenase n=1 Tax=Actinomycetospora sp. NBRC 106378 TaxID=3032208 RepID=UPI0024A2D189|nr:NAD(P)/FAD-dependent oxidoreductase [Actinomycetospora sp. NBRC 106378]GLZ56355.1 cyclohexanone monooxygenase [Actinomycetospora sp. NBRC 106378]
MTVTETRPEPTDAGAVEHVDVLVVGAGVAGIGAGHHLRTEFPDRSFLILDAHPDRGGTWWTHRYPGARSDSDLFTYGYRHKPWRGPSIASSGEILTYLDEVIDEDRLGERIRYRHRVVSTSWSSEENRWTVDVHREDTGETVQVSCRFLWMCQGYYKHDEPYVPEFPGRERFRGAIVHPQSWPADLDWTGKKVVVIGSGATAATVVPAMAETAEHVTMLQRTPTFMIAAPKTHELAIQLRALDIPEEWTYEILRRTYIEQFNELTRLSAEDPDTARQYLLDEMRPHLPEGFDIEKHFNPAYRPWQQRIALLPDGDMFATIKEGRSSVVTDTIETFTETGIRLSSGEELEADVIVTATGFNLSCFGDVAFTVDGEPVDFSERVTWRGIMIDGVPNMAFVFGYFRHSWTLRADLVSDLVVRLLRHLDDLGVSSVTPVAGPDVELRPWSDPENFNPGYVVRSQDRMFKQGDRAPWTHMHEFAEERHTLPAADLDDGSLKYG